MTASVDVYPLVARQELEQQALDDPERPFDRVLVHWAQHPRREDVCAHPSRIGQGHHHVAQQHRPQDRIAQFFLDGSCACCCLLAGPAAAIVGVVRRICFSIWWRMQTGARGR